ncbi:MAG: class I SAM-dependent methyltransferase [Myxococcales bacterium]|nr:class I SAM-dependent methyltransferase [Myxococcales bacterium]
MVRPLGHRGAVHMGLTGAANAFRYRPPRLEASGLASALTCTLRCGDRTIGPLEVLDVSPTGLGVALTDDAMLPILGTVVDRVCLHQGGQQVAQEPAVVVNVTKGAPARLGLRLTSGLFDLGVLKLRDAASVDSLFDSLQAQAVERQLLPATWRAAVADLVRLLERSRDYFQRLERSLPERQPHEHEEALFEELFAKWGPVYHGMLRDLHAQTRELDDDARALGIEYAGHLLRPLLREGAIHRRAYDKPQGYAGDYELMRLFFSPRLEGDTLYGRFLHLVGQRYPMGRTVVARERIMRAAVHERIASGQPVRVLSLACGPAIELQHVLDELPRVTHPVELLLLDQDEDALACAHRSLHRQLARRHEALAGVQLHALHFSVMQLLNPRDEAEDAVGREVIRDLDLVYSAGLFDYLPRSAARRLVRRLLDTLRPGGTLLLGNLREDPVSTWSMEHAGEWHLVYREPEDMLALAEGLPGVAGARVQLDQTERCVFLEVTKA